MTIKKKTSKKVTKKKVSKRSNPNNFAYNMGYKIGIIRAEKKQYELYDENEVYVSFVNKLLESKKFTSAIVDYKEFSLGYVRAGIEKYPTKNNIINESDYIAIQNSSNFDNILLHDHSEAINLISKGYDEVKETSEFSIFSGLYSGKYYYYVKFIIDNLLKFKYITKNNHYYIITDKGDVVCNNIRRNFNGLLPREYFLMKDVENYLIKGFKPW